MPSWIAYVLAGIVLGPLYIVFTVAHIPIPKGGLDAGERVKLFVLLFAPYPPCLLLHELGHAVAGRLAGFRFLLMAIGPWAVARTGSGWRVCRNRVVRPWSGAVVSLPNDDRRLRLRMAIMVAGGPSAVLPFALVAAWLILHPLGGGGPGGAAAFHEAAVTMGVFLWAGGMSFGNLIPARPLGLSSDGDHLLVLLRGGPAAERRAAVWMAAGALLGGVRPRDLSPRLIQRALAPDDAALDATRARLYAYYWALDRGEEERAGTFLSEAWARCDARVRSIRTTLLVELTYFVAWHDGDAAQAAKWYRQRPKSSRTIADLRALAALGRAAGKPGAAVAVTNAALARIGATPATGMAHAERDWAQAIRARAAAQQTEDGAGNKEDASADHHEQLRDNLL